MQAQQRRTVDEDGEGPDALGLQAAHQLLDVQLLRDDMLAIEQHRHRRCCRVLHRPAAAVPLQVLRRGFEETLVVRVQAACQATQRNCHALVNLTGDALPNWHQQECKFAVETLRIIAMEKVSLVHMMFSQRPQLSQEGQKCGIHYGKDSTRWRGAACRCCRRCTGDIASGFQKTQEATGAFSNMRHRQSL